MIERSSCPSIRLNVEEWKWRGILDHGSTADRISRFARYRSAWRTSQEPELDLIAVGAHPDDVEIACGGTLARPRKSRLRCGYRRPDRRRADPPLARAGGPAGRGQPRRRDPGGRRSGSTSTCPTAACSTRSRRASRSPRCFAGLSPRSCSDSGARPCSPRPTIIRRC